MGTYKCDMKNPSTTFLQMLLTYEPYERITQTGFHNQDHGNDKQIKQRNTFDCVHKRRERTNPTNHGLNA
jgi:hypothetical protein